MSKSHGLDFELLTQDDVAEMLGVTRRTVQNYVKAGIGPAVTVVGGCVRFRTDVLNDWLTSRTLPPGAASTRPVEAHAL